MPGYASVGLPFGFGTYFNTDLARAAGGFILCGEGNFRGSSLAANYTYDDSRVLASPNAFDPADFPAIACCAGPSIPETSCSMAVSAASMEMSPPRSLAAALIATSSFRRSV